MILIYNLFNIQEKRYKYIKMYYVKYYIYFIINNIFLYYFYHGILIFEKLLKKLDETAISLQKYNLFSSFSLFMIILN